MASKAMESSVSHTNRAQTERKEQKSGSNQIEQAAFLASQIPGFENRRKKSKRMCTTPATISMLFASLHLQVHFFGVVAHETT